LEEKQIKIYYTLSEFDAYAQSSSVLSVQRFNDGAEKYENLY